MTNKVYLDANILISHQVQGHDYHQRAVEILDDLWQKQYAFVISSLTMDELFYGMVYILRQDKTSNKDAPFSSFSGILEKVTKNVLSLNRLELVEFRNNPNELLEIVKIIKKYNFRPRDSFHFRVMEQNKLKEIATFDRDFQILEKRGIKVIS